MKRSIHFFVVLLLTSFSASAQKLPNIQEASLRAPANIKIDGKATEWNNQLRAYNKTTEIFYTISNDNDKLYLAVQATDLDIINKIICAGIIFTINGSGKMKDEGGVAVTYPVLHEDDLPKGAGNNVPPVNLDKPENMDANSFMIALNNDLSSKTKDLHIKGIKEVQDSLISIYNTYGIKAMALFNEKTVYTYELAIPLKYLNMSVNETKPFVYNIKLKSLQGGGSTLLNFSLGPYQFGAAFIKALNLQRKEIRAKQFTSLDSVNRTAVINDRVLNLINPTDFSGEYTLAK